MRRKTSIGVLPRFALMAAVLTHLPLSAEAATDVLSFGSASAAPGTVARMPVYIRDVSGTSLGMDRVARIQSIRFGATFTNSTLVVGCSNSPFANCQMTFTPAGVLAALTPTSFNIATGTNTITVRYTFDDSAQPIHYTLDAAAPGDLIGYIEMAITKSAPLGAVIAFTISPSANVTGLADNLPSGTVSETVGGELTVIGGQATISECTIAPTAANVSMTWSGGGCSSPNTTCPSRAPIIFTAIAMDNYTFHDCDLIIWDFGDGHFASGRTIVQTFVNFGTYFVRMAVINPAGTVIIQKTFTALIGGTPEKGPRRRAVRP